MWVTASRPRCDPLVLVQALQNAFPTIRHGCRNARSLQEEFASLGGVPVAVDVLEGVSGDLQYNVSTLSCRSKQLFTQRQRRVYSALTAFAYFTNAGT